MSDEREETGGRRGEPTVQARPTGPEARLIAFYERLESLLLSVVSLFLVLLVVVALVGVGKQLWNPLVVAHDFTDAAVRGIDAVFLAIILLELLHTTLSRGPISRQLQEFLVIGITAAVRHGLALAAGQGSSPREVVINLTINAAGVTLLVAALWVVRQQLRADHHEEAVGQDGSEQEGSDERGGRNEDASSHAVPGSDHTGDQA